MKKMIFVKGFIQSEKIASNWEHVQYRNLFCLNLSFGGRGRVVVVRGGRDVRSQINYETGFMGQDFLYAKNNIVLIQMQIFNITNLLIST